MNENKIHIAVIGAGTVARDNQIPAFLKCSEAEVTAVFDRHIERAEALAGSYGIPKAYCRLEDVLADKDIDVEYAYAFVSKNDNEAMAVIRTSDDNAAADILKEKGYTK